MAGATEDWKLPDAWLHPDVTHEVALTEAMAIPAWLPQNTVIHRVRHTDDPHQLAAQIREIDGSHPLPIDYIVTRKPASALRAAGEREQIRVVQLPSA